uniref:RNA polymerase sigma-70 region 2 domain-containing protein n=1 Tax=viral metagenome TaxID=1070528 RepID=A0A6C0KZF7_9ZZZZ|tara:strand:+ start:9426 stop:10031 length:606 start_codon:yes stop_codon:yes gene_type:complete
MLSILKFNTLICVYSLSLSKKQKALMVKQNTPLVQYFANRNNKQHYKNYNCPKIERDELVQEGMYGLLRAIDKYDPNFGTKFSTYASYWIQAYMIKYKNEKNHIHIPYLKRKTINRNTYLSENLYYIEDKIEQSENKELINSFNDLFVGLELSDYDKLLLNKRFVNNLSYKNIGKELGYSRYKVEKDFKNLYSKIRYLVKD